MASSLPWGVCGRTSLVSSVFALASCDHNEMRTLPSVRDRGLWSEELQATYEVVASSKFTTPSNLSVERWSDALLRSPHERAVMAQILALIGT
jgi:hypothetical protein